MILTFSSCGDDFLTLSSKKDTVTESAFFITQEDAYSALAGVYATLQNEATFTNVRNAADIEWAITGDLYEMDRSANRIELYSLRFPASNTILRDIYQNSYLGISRANVVIDKISKSPISQETKDQIKLTSSFYSRSLLLQSCSFLWWSSIDYNTSFSL